MPLSGTDPNTLLAPVALDRARMVAPFVLCAMVGSLVMSEPTGIPLSGLVIAFNVIAIPVLAALSIALWKRRLPVRFGHAVLALLWWFPVFGTVLSLYLSGQGARLQPLLFVEVCFLAILLQRRAVVGSLLLFNALWIPGYLHDLDTEPVYLPAMSLAQVAVLLFQHLHRNALLRAEVTAVELANQLAERKRLHEQLLHAQRMEAIGTLAAGLAHDMNNVLGSITSMTELLREEASELSRVDLDGILKQSARGAELTRGLLAFSRKGQYRKLVVDIDQLLRDVVPLLSRTLPKAIEIAPAIASRGARVHGDPAHLQQVIVNLAVNAADAMGGTGTLTIASERAILDEAAAAQLSLQPGPYVCIRVADTGRGMDPETLKRAFEPFFTTKPLGKGTGLGLSTVWGIVQSHGGAVDAASQLGAGTLFTIHLPVTAAPTLAETPAPPAAKAKRTTVLVIDDEAAVRSSTIRLLQRKGLDAIGAGDGEEALRVFAEHEKDIGLVILDMGMPHMGGRECFEQLRKTSKVPVLIATGYAIDADMRELTGRGAALIEKPYPANVLAREVTRLLEAN